MTQTGDKLTESIVFGLLRDKLASSGNGGAGEWALLPQVRNAAGFNANRTFDAVALGLWPSRGHTLEIYEIKVDRSDWRRELTKPGKAEDACKIADRFWIIAPSGAVHKGELPPTWGLIEIRGDGAEKPWSLRTKTAAPLLTEHGKKAPPLTRGLVVAMLRSAPGAVPGGKVPSVSDRELAAARQAGYAEGEAHAKAWAESSARADRSHRETESAQYAELESALRAAGLDRFEASPVRLARHADRIVWALSLDEIAGRTQPLVDRLREACDRVETAIKSTEDP